MSITLTPIDIDYSTELSQVIEKRVRTLVGNPEAVKVATSTNMDRTIIHVRVARPDVGKVVGKDGRTARALRTILAAAGNAHEQRFVLDIEEPVGD